MRREPLARIGVLLALALGMSGCEVTRTSGLRRGSAPVPRTPPPPPDDARVDAVVLNVGAAPTDTDGNGYPDLIQATAHLFDRRYAPPLRRPGAFVFRLYPTGGLADPEIAPLRTWRIEGPEREAARSRSTFGPCYRFRLSLLEDGTDVVPIRMADLVCGFEPAGGGETTWSGAISAIQLGHRVRVPGPPPEGDGESAAPQQPAEPP